MGDPRFERTVILIIQHSPSGALGIVINKPIGETSVASVFEALGQKGSDVAGDVRVKIRQGFGCEDDLAVCGPLGHRGASSSCPVPGARVGTVLRRRGNLHRDA